MYSTDQKAETAIVAPAFSELVLTRVRLLAKRRIAWLRKIWSDVTHGGIEPFNAHVEVDGYLYDADGPAAEKAWTDGEHQLEEVNRQLAETEKILQHDGTSRLSTLIRIFGLNTREADVLQACLAISIDPNLARVFAYLQDNSARNYVTEALVARLFGYGPSLLLHAGSPLKVWELVKETVPVPGEPTRLECDPFIKNWLLGLDGIDETLVGFSSFQPVKKPLPGWPVKKAVGFIQGLSQGEEATRARIFVSGPDGSGRRSFAAAVCRQLGLPLLTIQTDRIAENRWQQVYVHAQRQAFLSGCPLAWQGENIQDKFWPRNIPSYPVQFVTGEADSFIQPDPGFADLRIEMPVISYKERLSLWKEFVPSASAWKKNEQEELALRYQATIGQIVSIGKRGIGQPAEAYEALRADAGHRLGNLAQQMNSAFTWSDLVLTGYVKKGLEDFAFEATERIRFWEEPAARRLFAQGQGLIALFTGSPGTGKTMAAQVIAAALRLDLFRIDLSSVVSKYIGESSKNIERILSRAKSMNIVLLFDEADALFGKRTEIKDAHDRYANTDTNYLLQAIEQYPGIVILASNKKSNIDTGFMRRFRYVFEFPKPDATQRLQLWKSMVGELAGDQTAAKLDKDLDTLSKMVEITGAQIKLAVLSALFMARRDRGPLTATHLLKGLERELVKEERGLGKQVQESLHIHI